MDEPILSWLCVAMIVRFTGSSVRTIEVGDDLRLLKMKNVRMKTYFIHARMKKK
jgi:hypothetical protein